MVTTVSSPFANGCDWVRADFHLHTQADKEFSYTGEENSFAAAYVAALKKADIRLGVISNHNKFNVDEFKALRKRAKKEAIGLLPGVELSVNDGANGVHTVIVFSDAWLADGQDYISQFLNVAFSGKTPAQYEQENGRTNDDLLSTLKMLESFDRDFFIVFAHVEAASGLWNEIDGGRMEDLSKNPLLKRYCLGFQKVRTHDKGAKCRVKVQGWWDGKYPPEVEGSDPKTLDEIGRGQQCFLKIGEFSFDAVKYALTDHEFRVAKSIPKVEHSHVDAIRFDGGLLDGVRIPFSPHLNCLIGIQGSGKSSVLESLRYALAIPFGEKSQDKDYKQGLLPYVLKSGGKVVVEATDRHGTRYEISRIWNHEPDVYIDGKLRPGVSIRETIITKPLYFGQKDLSAAGKGFDQDLVEKLVGEALKPVRQKIAAAQVQLKSAVENLLAVESDAEEKQEREEQLRDVNFRLEQFDKHGVKAKLEKQVSFNNDVTYCVTVDELVEGWRRGLDEVVEQAAESFEELEAHASKHNAPLFKTYDEKLTALKTTVADAKKIGTVIAARQADLTKLREDLEIRKDGLKEEFAEIERQLVKSLEELGVTSIQPDAYVKLVDEQKELTAQIAELAKKTSKVKGKRDALLAIIAQLNDGWLEEFRVIGAALAKINSAQSSLKVDSTFKGDKGAFRDKLEAVFRGHNIRKESYQALAENYSDFGQIYKDLANASEHAKGKAETFRKFVQRQHL